MTGVLRPAPASTPPAAMTPTARAPSGLWIGLAALAAAAGPLPAAPKVDFARDVLPILSDNCFHCHGPDPKTRQAGLRLDTREGVFRPRKRRPLIVPGKPAQSEIVRRIGSKDADLVMPPPDSNR